jgi:hypothetical protein
LSEYEDTVEEAKKEIAKSLDKKKHHILLLRDILEKQGEAKSEIANLIAHSLSEYVTKKYVYRILGDEYSRKYEKKKDEDVPRDEYQSVLVHNSGNITESGTDS